MTLETIYYIGQTIAVMAILISLIFVGIQMRDGNKLARAQMHQQIADGFTELCLIVPQQNEACFDAMHSVEKFKALSRKDVENMNGIMLGIWKHYENVFYQYESGFVAEDYWRSTSAYMAMLVHREGIRFWWEGRKRAFAPAFVAYVESLGRPDMPLDMKGLEPVSSKVGEGQSHEPRSEAPDA